MFNRSGKVIAIFALALVLLCAAIAVRPSRAESTAISKVSSDLHGLQNENHQVSVIVQPTSTWNPLLDSLLTSLGGALVSTVENLPLRVVTLPANRINELASSDQVRYISLDREIRMLGHVTYTTGADAIRSENLTAILNLTNATKLDGSGIGIAIVDSGIDKAHSSFSNALGVTRVLVSRDFTGENRTDDPFGHGTHVAALAAGNEKAASGAYAGIATNANLVNLRVLDSHGVGRVSNLLRATDWILSNRTLYNIRVVNMSLGQFAIDSYRIDPLCQAVRRLVDAGVVVVAAAGNDGKKRRRPQGVRTHSLTRQRALSHYSRRVE